MPIYKHTQSPLKYIVALFVFTRIVLLITGYIATIFVFPHIPEELKFQFLGKTGQIFSGNLLLDIWVHWDAGWYFDIARNGYSVISPPQVCCNQVNIVFFPLYPLLVRAIGIFVGSNYYLAGVFISNAAFFIASFVFYKLLRLDYKDIFARRVLKYLYFSPVGFIFSGMYSESLFFLLLLCTFYFARTNRFFLVGLSGYLLSLTRSLGVLISLPLFLIYVAQAQFSVSKLLKRTFVLILLSLGTLTFYLYLYKLTGDVFAHAKYEHQGWGVEFVNPIVSILSVFLLSVQKNEIFWFFQSLYATFSLVLFTLSFRYLSGAYLVTAGLMLIAPLLIGPVGLFSIERYVAVIFPLYITLAHITRDKTTDALLTVVFGISQIVLMVLWSNNLVIV